MGAKKEKPSQKPFYQDDIIAVAVTEPVIKVKATRSDINNLIWLFCLYDTILANNHLLREKKISSSIYHK